MREWKNLTWPEAKEAVEEMPACVLPLGAIEAHGPHMMLDVDNHICEEQCRRICQAMDIILMPTIPIGQVWSLNRFPGTLTISYDTLISLVKDLMHSFRKRGFRLVFIHSHHYGNVPAVKQAVRECYDEFQDMKMVILEERGSMREMAKKVCTSPFAHPVFWHACEVETSQALECCPDRVYMERAICDYPEFPEDFDSTPTYWDEVTDTGVMGDAAAGSADKGRELIGAEVEAMIGKVKYELDLLKMENRGDKM